MNTVHLIDGIALAGAPSTSFVKTASLYYSTVSPFQLELLVDPVSGENVRSSSYNLGFTWYIRTFTCLRVIFFQEWSFGFQADVPVLVQFSEAVAARFFRVAVEDYNTSAAMTMELYGSADREFVLIFCK